MTNFNKIKNNIKKNNLSTRFDKKKRNLQQKSTRKKKISTRFDRIKAKNRQLSTQKIKNGTARKHFYDNISQL